MATGITVSGTPDQGRWNVGYSNVENPRPEQDRAGMFATVTVADAANKTPNQQKAEAEKLGIKMLRRLCRDFRNDHPADPADAADS